MKTFPITSPRCTHELRLEDEIKHLGKPAGWYGAHPTRLMVPIRRGRGGRHEAQGFRIPSLNVSITAKEFKRLERLGRTREIKTEAV